MKYKKLFKLQHTFMEDTTTLYVDYGGVGIEEYKEMDFLKYLQANVLFENRPFTSVRIWDDQARIERKSLFGGHESWTAQLIYVLDIEGKFFELKELEAASDINE